MLPRIILLLFLCFSFLICHAQNWQAFNDGLQERCTDVFVDESNNMLYAAGYFNNAGGVASNHIAAFDGINWSTLGTGFNGVTFDVVVYNDEVYVGGQFTTPVSFLAKWNGTDWVNVGGGVNNIVVELEVINDELHVGGTFTQAGGETANRIAKWDGNSWSTYGIGFPQSVQEITQFNGEVIACGEFWGSGSNLGDGIMRWTGTEWLDLGGSTNANVYSVFLDEAANELYIGGDFGTAGGSSATRIAKWDGMSWNALGTGVGGQVNAIGKFNEEIIIGGNFTTAGGVSAKYIASWNGADYAPIADGFNDFVTVVSEYNGSLLVGGEFRWDATFSNFVNHLAGLVLPPPVAGFSLDQDTVCPGGFIQFTDNSTNSPVSWNWNFDGENPTTSTLQNPLIQFNEPGTYDVELIVTNSQGSDTVLLQDTITVLETLTDYNLSGDSTICLNDCIQLQASGADIYQWTEPSGQSSNQSSFEVCPNQTTMYFLNLQSDTGCAFDSVEVVVNLLPVITVSGNDSICSGDSIPLTAAGAENYLWLSGSIFNPHTVSTSVDSVFQVVGTDLNGCVDTAFHAVYVRPLPIVNITGDTVLCPGEQTTLIGNTSDTYLWSTDEQTQEINLTPLISQMYTLTITDNNGCVDSTSINVIVHPVSQTPSITQNMDDLIASTGFSYVWFDINNEIIGTEQTLTPLVNGDYFVQVTDSNGCSATSDVFMFQWTNVEERSDAIWELYPNPVADELHLHVDPNMEVEQIILINNLSQVFKEFDVTYGQTNEMLLDLRVVPTGIYTLILKHQKGKSSVHVVVTR